MRYVKDYFMKRGTVSKWWNPTKGDYSYLFNYQLNEIYFWLSSLPKGAALEVSCGKGRGTKRLNKLFKNYIATDISKEMIEIAKKKCPKVTFKQMDAEDLKFKPNSFNAVICLAAIVHYPNPQKALNDFYRVLKPGGFLVFDSDNKYSIRRLAKKIYRFLEGNKNIFGGDIFQTYSKKKMKIMLERSGFKIKKIRYVGTISPIEFHRKDGSSQKIVGPRVSRFFHRLGIDKIPLINRFATYHLILAQKPQKN